MISEISKYNLALSEGGVIIDDNGKLKPPSPSEDLAAEYLKIMENILKKPNFSGYYEEVKESIVSKCQLIFLLNWYKFKPYRVRNNFKIGKRGKFIRRNLEKGTNIIYLNIPLKKYDMMNINNRTFTVKECEKVGDEYVVKMFNKLKNEVNTDTDVTILHPKTDFDNPDDGVLIGAFSFFSLFVFTGAKNEITTFKKRKEKMQGYLENKESNSLISMNQYTTEEL